MYSIRLRGRHQVRIVLEFPEFIMHMTNGILARNAVSAAAGVIGSENRTSTQVSLPPFRESLEFSLPVLGAPYLLSLKFLIARGVRLPLNESSEPFAPVSRQAQKRFHYL